MTVRRAVLALLALVAGALVWTAPAGAALVTHAQLLATTPADGDTVESVAEVTLTFSEDVNAQFVQVRVEGPAGDEVDGAPRVDGPDVTQALATGLPAGEHRVTYRVVSVDGHPVSGTFAFTTTAGPATSSPTGSPTATSPGPSPSPDASGTPGPDAAPASEPAGSTPGWVVPVLAVLVVAPVVAGAVLLLRRRRGAPADPSA